MAQFSFGSGALYGINTTTNSTPRRFGTLQEGSVEFSATTKALMGEYQFPVAVARAGGKVTGKAKFARIYAGLYADLFFGITPTTGLLSVVNGESGTVPGTPYAITVANSATWVTDLGVVNATTGVPYTKVASSPTTGQYSVASGVYTFAAADTTNSVQISYTYTAASGGKVITITNQLLGTTPTFMVVLNTIYNSIATTIQLNSCVASKLTFPTKNEDFTIPEFDFEAMADASGTIGKISATE